MRPTDSLQNSWAENVSTQESANVQKLKNSVSISELVCVELCAGSAGLSSELKAVGFQVLPVDHAANAHQQKVRIIAIDLTSSGAFALVAQILRSGKVIYCHISPPCGTASAARNRPVPLALRKKGAPSPPPLRDAEYPLGFPWLTGQNLQRVTAANCIYLLCYKVALLCVSLNIVFSLENPLNSLFWSIPYVMKLFKMKELVVAIPGLHARPPSKQMDWLAGHSWRVRVAWTHM